MSKQDKQLIIKEFFFYLPYGIMIKDVEGEVYEINIETAHLEHLVEQVKVGVVDIYLRPLSSMTEEEAITIFKIIYGDDTEFSSVEVSDNCIEIWDYDYNEDGFSERTVCTIYFEEIVRSMEVLDYILSRHFDVPHWNESENTYKTMIELGLVLPAPEGMYN